MTEEEWAEWEVLHQDYEAAQAEYDRIVSSVRGAFSEMRTLGQSMVHEEHAAHERAERARTRMRTFLAEHLDK